MNNRPIGIFDSGIGGTSILNEIIKLLPNENTIYLADSKNAPYGKKTPEEIIALSKKNTEYLLHIGCKLVVVACNTATTNAIDLLRKEYPIPFIGIEPAIKPASLQTKTNVIGILATQGTLNSSLFEKTANTLDKKISIVEQVGEGLVELIEQGKIDSAEMDTLLQKYLYKIIQSNADHIVLGCTHYPYLIPKIKTIIGDQITLIDSGEAVARQTKHILEKHGLLRELNRKGVHEIRINSSSDSLQLILKNSGNFQIKEQPF